MANGNIAQIYSNVIIQKVVNSGTLNQDEMVRYIDETNATNISKS